MQENFNRAVFVAPKSNPHTVLSALAQELTTRLGQAADGNRFMVDGVMADRGFEELTIIKMGPNGSPETEFVKIEIDEETAGFNLIDLSDNRKFPLSTGFEDFTYAITKIGDILDENINTPEPART